MVASLPTNSRPRAKIRPEPGTGKKKTVITRDLDGDLRSQETNKQMDFKDSHLRRTVPASKVVLMQKTNKP